MFIYTYMYIYIDTRHPYPCCTFVQVVSSKGRTHALDTIPHTIVDLEHILA